MSGCGGLTGEDLWKRRFLGSVLWDRVTEGVSSAFCGGSFRRHRLMPDPDGIRFTHWRAVVAVLVGRPNRDFGLKFDDFAVRCRRFIHRGQQPSAVILKLGSPRQQP